MDRQTIVGQVLSDVLLAFLILLAVRWISELVLAATRSRPSPAFVPLLELTYTVTDPPVRFLQRLIPPLRIGNAAIDLGFIVLIVAIQALRSTVLTRI